MDARALRHAPVPRPGDADAGSLLAGIGLKPAHYSDLLRQRQPIGFLEVHAENYFAEDDLHARVLTSLRRDYPISLHCIGLSLGSATGVSQDHLLRLRGLVDRVDPFLVSDHLSWGVADRVVVNELLPLPFTREALATVVNNVDRVQQTLRRPILVENIAAYVRFKERDIEEADFLNALAARTGCRLLLDVTNLHVNQCNHGEDADMTLSLISPAHIGQYHVAGHLATPTATIDDHGSQVSDESWALYARALAHAGALPTVVEWDRDVPTLHTMIAEIRKAAHLCSVATGGGSA